MAIGSAIREHATVDGHAVDWARSLAAARDHARVANYGLVLLDLQLPDGEGISYLQSMRRSADATPVIVLTARDQISNRIEGLNAGADDYLVKPFDLDELGARIRALLRRSAGRGEAVFMHRGVRIDPASREVTRNGEPVTLSPREFAVLEALMLRPGAILSRAQLEDRLYGWDESVESNAVEVYIHGLRRKLGHDFIQNVRGVGYFVPKGDGQEGG